jgi:tetrahydromethanopterin S-methyltransferase subunit G
MKKTDIYELGFKLFGFYLIVKSITILFGNISLLFISKDIHFENGLIIGILSFIVYLFVGLLLFFRTNKILTLFQINDSKNIEILPTKYSYHIAIILLGGLLIVNNISDIGISSYEKETLGEFQNTIYKPTEKTDFHPEVIQLDIPKSYTTTEKKDKNIGSIIGLVLGILTILFSKQLSAVLTPRELKENKE